MFSDIETTYTSLLKKKNCTEQHVFEFYSLQYDMLLEDENLNFLSLFSNEMFT